MIKAKVSSPGQNPGDDKVDADETQPFQDIQFSCHFTL